MIIRPITPAEWDAVRQLKPQMAAHTLKRRITETARGVAVCWLAEEAGELRGQVFLRFYGQPAAPDYPDMEDLYVHPDWRGQGIGTALLRQCEAVVRARGCDRIGLSVGVHNHRARRLYERLGYHDAGRDPYIGGMVNGRAETVLDMVKVLA
jgi:ribosomal protein S18 acetylase RimI-like enzyme